MNIGIEIIDHNQKLDLSRPDCHAYGIGGTQYEFVLLQYYLSQDPKYQVYVYHTSENQYAHGVISRKVASHADMLEQVKADQIDVLIVQQAATKEEYEAYGTVDAAVVIWAHNNIDYEGCRGICQTDNIKRVVFVSHEQYDGYIDDDVIRKGCYIYNMYIRPDAQVNRQVSEHTVSFMGALVPWKGFHLLAQVWKDILAEVPDAKLHVMGSNYNGKNVEDEYYKRYMSHLTDAEGKLLPSVTFHGNVSAQKKEIFEHTCVGVVNPSGLSETFCISAVEFEAYGVPVCSKNGYALLETVAQGKTGLLSSNTKELKENIVTLLKDEAKNQQMSRDGMVFYEKFTPEKVVPKWKALLEQIEKDTPVRIETPKKNLKDNYKWVRMVIYVLRIKLGIRILPSYKKLQHLMHK